MAPSSVSVSSTSTLSSRRTLLPSETIDWIEEGGTRAESLSLSVVVVVLLVVIRSSFARCVFEPPWTTDNVVKSVLRTVWDVLPIAIDAIAHTVCLYCTQYTL